METQNSLQLLVDGTMQYFQDVAAKTLHNLQLYITDSAFLICNCNYFTHNLFSSL